LQQQNAPRLPEFQYHDRENFSVSRGILQPAGLTLDRAFRQDMCSKRIVSCCSDLDLINVAKLSAGRQQLSPSLAWHCFRGNSG
jgi:hypothetical protein